MHSCRSSRKKAQVGGDCEPIHAGESYVILKMLPGQKEAVAEWYLRFVKDLKENHSFEVCRDCPSLLKYKQMWFDDSCGL